MKRRLDVALALALFALAEEHVWSGAAGGSRAVTATAAAIATLALAWRSRRTVEAAAAISAAIAAQSLLASAPQAPWLMVTVAAVVYSVGCLTDVRGSLFGAALVAAALAIDFAAARDRTASGAVFVALLVALPWLAGRALNRRATDLERDQDARAKAAVAEERARIARELHDMVAHAVSLVVVQAEAAEAVLDTDPSRAREQLQGIQRTGRQALSEMTRLLGMLRREGDDASLAPQPSLSRLDLLIADVRVAGLAVAVETEGETSDIPPGVDLAAYRIIQEALTNTRKHANATQARVVLRYEPRSLELAVLDDGTRVNGGRAGHGLVGMRERVQLYGGTLAAGHRPDGGYEVHAHLPFDAASQ